MDADFGLSNYHQPYNSTTSFVWTLPFGKGQRWASNASPAARRAHRRLAARRHQPIYAGEPVTFTYTPGATFVVSGIAQDFRGANNYRPNVTCDPMARARSGRSPTGSTGVRRGADRSEPAVRQRAAQHRPRAELLAARLRGLQAVRARRPGAVRVPPRGLQPAEPHELPRPQRQPQRRRVRHDHVDLDPRQLQLGFKFLW